MQELKLIPLLIAGIIFIFAYIAYPRQIFLFYILVKPVVDRFGDAGASVEGTSLGYHYIAALVIPTMSMMYVMVMRENFFSLPHGPLIFLYILLNIVSFLVEGRYSLDIVGYFIRIFLPLFLFFSIPFILSDRESILKFVRYSAISGLFPCVMVALQKMGIVAQNRVAEGFGNELYDRATGGYADAFSAAMPIIISIFCIYFLLQYSGERRERNILYKGLLVVYLVSLVFTYHRMSFIVVALVTVFWAVINRKTAFILLLAGVTIVSVPLLMRFVPSFYGDIYVAERTHGVTPGDSTEQMAGATLHGRGWVWKKFLDKFNRSSSLEKLLGIEMAGRAPHNDYLRVLITNGLLGLSVYLCLLIALGLRLSRAYLYFRKTEDTLMSQFALTSGFFFIFYVLGSTTLAISLLSSLTWYLWIFAGVTYLQMSRTKLQDLSIPETQ